MALRESGSRLVDCTSMEACSGPETYVDWTNNNVNGGASRNRAHLYVLDAPTSGATFSVTEIDGDGSFNLRDGIGSGVTGVKIDDVNGDGTSEIWCCDALHLYLFSQKTTPWHCIYQSGDLCAFPGFYNNIFPIKDVDPVTGKTVTVKLILNSPGYVMEFAVDRSLVPH